MIVNIATMGADNTGSKDIGSQILPDAIGFLTAQGGGIIVIPSTGKYLLQTPQILTTGITITGIGIPAGGVSQNSNGGSTIIKDFNGDAFNFNGALPSGLASGGGIERLRIVQAYGLVGTNNGCAVKLSRTGPSQAPAWLKIWNCIFEEAGVGSWTWPINLDGGTTFLPDIYISNVSTHSTGIGGATVAGALRLNGSGPVNVNNCNFFDSAGNVSIGDTNSSGQIHFADSGCSGTLYLGNCHDIAVVGGTWTTITDSGNITGYVNLFPSKLVNPFTLVSTGGHVNLMTFGEGSGGHYSAGNFGVGGPVEASCALDIQSTIGALKVPVMTTTQKNNLTALNGMIVYDSTLNVMQGYINGAWTNI